MKLIKKNTKKGFTLIELVIVIAILAILALILVPTIGSYTKKANVAKAKTSVRALYTEAVLINADNSKVTVDGTARGPIIEGLIKKGATTDTVTVTTDASGAVDIVGYKMSGDTKSYTFNGKELKYDGAAIVD